MARLIYSTVINEERLNVVQMAIGNVPLMRMYGLGAGESVPKTCEQAATGFVIAQGDEPAQDWLGFPSSSKVGDYVQRSNIWSTWVLSIVAAGEIKYLRIFDASGQECGMQCEVKDLSVLTGMTGTEDPETGVYNGQHFEQGVFYVDGSVITPQQVANNDVLTLQNFSISAGNQARYADVP